MHQRLVLIALIAVLSGPLLLELRAQRLPAPLNLPQQQQVISQNPKIGIHTRLGGINNEAFIRRSLELTREMGASWIVELFPWAYVQPRSRYGFDWAGADTIINHAARQGLTVVARLDIVPQWARPSNTTDRYLAPEYYQDYANYVAAFAERYRPLGVRHLQIWNEPNLAFEWGARPPDPGAYTALLKVVYPTVKARVPDAIIIAGALSPGSEIAGGGVRMDDMQFLASLYDAGAAPYFDMWGVHAYGAQSPPDEAPAPERVNFRRVELARAMMVANGDEAKPIIITEGGYNDHPRWRAAVRPSQRVRWTIETYEQARTYEWLEAAILWQLGTNRAERSYADNWSFITPDLQPRAIYYAVQEYARAGQR